MSTALVPISDLERMATAFAKSNLFGTKTPDQCMALLLLAQGEGLHPAIAMRDFDVIQGKPAKKAEAMLRSFIAAGGIVEWHEMTDTKASASFSHPQGSNGKFVPISWDMDRAKKAGLTGKDNWQKYGRQMLANRVISEGCRRVYPAATSGLYEPGEVRMIARQEKDMGKAELVKDEEEDAKLRALETASPASKDYPPSPSAPPADAGGHPVTRTQMLRALCRKAYGEDWQVQEVKILDKCGVASAEEASEKDWADATAFLGKRIKKMEIAEHI